MNPNFETVTVLDGLAAHLASMSGVNWEGLNAYPGYGRNYWRDRARRMLEEMSIKTAPPRRKVECVDGWLVTG